MKCATWEWHVLSLCRADDPDREPRFRQAAADLRARPYISDLDDSPVLAPLSPDLREIKDRIRPLAPNRFDLVLTHGPKGEYYRHERHEQAHRAVREMAESGEIVGELVFFAYESSANGVVSVPSAAAPITIRLTTDEFARKRRIIRDIYGFAEGSFEFESAGPVEAFDGPNRGAALRGALETEEARCEYCCFTSIRRRRPD